MQTSEDIVIELLQGNNSIPVKLRNKEDIQKDYNLLLDEIDILKKKYKGKNEIPKNLSYSFLDISNYFIVSDKIYTTKELELIEDMKDRLYEELVEFYEM
jgi:hypothetical protein